MDEPTPEQVAWRLRDRPGFCWLDGGDADWHVLAWDPVDVTTRLADWPAAGRRRVRRGPGEASVPFTSGCIGYVGYGAGCAVEAVPPQGDTPEPPVWLGRFEGSLCHRRGRWIVSGPATFRREAERLLAAARDERMPPVAPATPTTARTVDREPFVAGVERVLAWIRAGDCYQVNLSRPVWVDVDDPFAVYRRLRSSAAASHGAWIHVDRDTRVLSSSPELLLAVDGPLLRSDPIKGTRPRGTTPAEDAAQRADLLAHPKDHAELAMIVDLVRNDLGRVARTGSVQATTREIRSHPYVHHANWPVTAELAGGLDGWDALAAVFPPGSVTGAPKIRATERIAELESTPRGVYCGTIGFASDHGHSRWNVAIRTGVWYAGTLRYHVGGGIVADSDPASEWEETVAKGRLLARASGAPLDV